MIAALDRVNRCRSMVRDAEGAGISGPGAGFAVGAIRQRDHILTLAQALAVDDPFDPPKISVLSIMGAGLYSSVMYNTCLPNTS